MKAETVYNVIQALPEEEIPKLFKLLGVPVPDVKKNKNSKVKIITIEEATDMLKAYHFKGNKD